MKVIEFNGVKLKVISKQEFAKVAGMATRKFHGWVDKGILLPPTFIDEENRVNDWSGNMVPRKYYLYQEAVAVRSIMRDYTFARRKVLSLEFIDRVQDAMRKIRQKIQQASKDLMDYPLIVEFTNFQDLHIYLRGLILDPELLQEVCVAMYQRGNKILKEHSDAREKADKEKYSCKKRSEDESSGEG